MTLVLGGSKGLSSRVAFRGGVPLSPLESQVENRALSDFL